MTKRRIERCLVAVRRSGKIRICDKPGRVERSGVWYCRRHDPLQREAIKIARAKQANTHWVVQEAKRKLERDEHERQFTIQTSLWRSAEFLRQIVTGQQLTEEWKGRARECLTPLVDTLNRYRRP